MLLQALQLNQSTLSFCPCDTTSQVRSGFLHEVQGLSVIFIAFVIYRISTHTNIVKYKCIFYYIDTPQIVSCTKQLKNTSQMSTLRDRVQKAVLAFEGRNQPAKKRKTKNQKPERDLQKLVLAILESKGWLVYPIEAKAVYSQAAGRYLNSQTTPGLSDIVGSTPDGFACFIELKAPGRRSALADHQRTELIKAIDRSAFAGCFDSIESILTIYSQWKTLRISGSADSHKARLMMALP